MDVKFSNVVAVLGVIIAFLAWRCPHSPRPSSLQVESETPTNQVVPPVPSSRISSTSAEISPQVPPQPFTAVQRRSEAPVEFDLRDGEQKVLLSGQLSVGVKFNSIEGESFLTLLVTTGAKAMPYAIVTPNARLIIAAEGKKYYLSLLSQDDSSRIAHLRIDLVQGDSTQ